jgi:hypothetical protein
VNPESEPIEDGGITPVETSVIREHESAAMDIQVATAQKLGRSIKHFQSDLEAWACSTQEIAQECTYVLRKGGTRIVGPSIRFAELLQVAYRHIVVDTFIEKTEHSHVVVGAMARDLFRNVAVRARVRRNILTREGKRYGADMIQTTVQAGASLALRNAIIRLIPKALWLPVWLKSRDVAQGTGEDGRPVVPFSERVERAFAALQAMGATADQVLAYLEKDSKQDLDATDLDDLANKFRSIRAGEVDVDKAFPVPEAETTAGQDAADNVAGKVKAAAKKKAAPRKKAAAKKAAKKKAAAKAPASPQEEADAKAAQSGAADDAGEGMPSLDL